MQGKAVWSNVHRKLNLRGARPDAIVIMGLVRRGHPPQWSSRAGLDVRRRQSTRAAAHRPSPHDGDDAGTPSPACAARHCSSAHSIETELLKLLQGCWASQASCPSSARRRAEPWTAHRHRCRATPSSSQRCCCALMALSRADGAPAALRAAIRAATGCPRHVAVAGSTRGAGWAGLADWSGRPVLFRKTEVSQAAAQPHERPWRVVRAAAHAFRSHRDRTFFVAETWIM